MELSDGQVRTLRDLCEELCGGCAYGLPVIKEGNAPHCQYWHRISVHTNWPGVQGCGADWLWRILGLPAERQAPRGVRESEE